MRRLLQEVRHDPAERLEDFAERTQGLAVDGYPEKPDSFVEIVAIDAFLKMCYDKRAALVAMDKNPESLEKALQYVRGAVANQKVILGGRKSEIKRVTFDDPDNTENKPDGNFSARVVGKEDYKRRVTDYERRSRKTEDELAETKSIVKKILDVFTQNQGQQRSRVPMSPTREMPFIPDRGCFQCGEEGHFARNCPNGSFHSPDRKRSRSPSPLNSMRSRMMADS